MEIRPLMERGWSARTDSAFAIVSGRSSTTKERLGKDEARAMLHLQVEPPT